MKAVGSLSGIALLVTGLLVGCAEEPTPVPIRPVRSIVVGAGEAIDGRWWPGRARATLDAMWPVSGSIVTYRSSLP